MAVVVRIHPDRASYLRGKSFIELRLTGSLRYGPAPPKSTAGPASALLGDEHAQSQAFQEDHH